MVFEGHKKVLKFQNFGYCNWEWQILSTAGYSLLNAGSKFYNLSLPPIYTPLVSASITRQPTHMTCPPLTLPFCTLTLNFIFTSSLHLFLHPLYTYSALQNTVMVQLNRRWAPDRSQDNSGLVQINIFSDFLVLGVANFRINYLRQFSFNFKNSCAHLAANFLNFSKHT